MKLKILGRYQNGARNIDVYPGDEIEVKDELGAWLMNDAPGCFADPSAPAQVQGAEQGATTAAQREADAILDQAKGILEEAMREAERIRANAHADTSQKPFDRAPDGTTLPTDSTPPVVTGPDSGVGVTRRADADEQQAVIEEQGGGTPEEHARAAALATPPDQRTPEQRALLGEEEDEEAKAPTVPARDKMVRSAPRQKDRG